GDQADLAAGRYDAAAVEQWLVDWSAPELMVLLMRGARVSASAIEQARREGLDEGSLGAL
ncbi:MAG TPA: hypothetical protein PLO33_15160, partial [Kouleothrix sp.]|nr:hypothetical protein [Kouleothrix sp.]